MAELKPGRAPCPRGVNGNCWSGERGRARQIHNTHDKVLGWCMTPGRSARGTEALSAAAPELCLWWLHVFLDSMYIENTTCERNYILTEMYFYWTSDLTCCQCRAS